MRWFVLVALVGCAPPIPRIFPDPPVATASSPPGSGVGIIYDARVCSIAITGERGLTWHAPDAAFEAENSPSGAILVAPWELPPGHYTVVDCAIADGWQGGHSKSGRLMGRTDCGSPHHASVRIPFTVEPDRFALVAIPAGTFGFWEYRHVVWAEHMLGPWFPKLRDAAEAARDALIASKRRRRDGYDIYSNCDSGTTVSRDTGTPFSFVAVPNDRAVREQFRAYALGALPGIRSQHASGFGGSCRGKPAFMIMISDPNELDLATRQLGEWLVRENLAGDLVVEVSDVPHLL
jgi:hypothetical protein